jgi:hypothetical protein
MRTIALTLLAADPVADQYFSGASNFGEAPDGVTKICSKPENANISVVSAEHAFMSKMHGAKPQDAEEYLRVSRAVSNGK